MRFLISILLASVALCCAAPSASAQSNLLVVTTCGTLPLAYAPGAVRTGTQDVNGRACGTATVTGGGDATAANQVLQIAQETAINTLLGLQADAACATDNGTCTLAALVKRLNQRLTSINTTLGTPMQATGGTVGLVAGSAIVGNFRIDQTTPGTTNGVQANAGTNLNTSALALEAGGNLATLAGQIGTKAAGTAAATSALGGIVRNSTAPTPTNGQQVAKQSDPVGSQFVSTEGRKQTYGAITGVALVASATDVFAITGSASKTVGVNRVQCAGVATAANATPIALVKRSTANTGGTSSAVTASAYDANNAAPTATLLAYTANPTVGTAVGFLRYQLLSFTTAATPAVPVVPVIWDFTTRNTQPIILRGTGQVIAVSMAGVTVAGGNLTCDIEFTEWTD